LNQPRKEGEAILFTPLFHRTTLTPPDGEEIIIKNGTVNAIRKKGSSKIPEDGYVLSIQEKHPMFNTFSTGMDIDVNFEILPQLEETTFQKWDTLDYIVGGAPLLIKDTIKTLHFDVEQTIPTFITNKHARTAIGTLTNDIGSL